MPTYVYRCDDCDHQFELFQRMSDDPVEVCPQCDSKVRRVIHPVGVVFKGSGWYINDSRAKNSANGTSADDKSDKAESKTSDDSKTSDTPKAEPAKTAAD
jgi:putative FmdB family regulatory protein